MTATSVAVLALALGQPGPTPALTPADVQFYACEAAAEQQAIEHRWRQFEFLRDDVLEKLDGETLQTRSIATRYIHRSKPDGINVNQMIAREGQPLGAEDAAREKAKFEARLAELEDPQVSARALAELIQESDAKASAMAAVTEAFHLRFEAVDFLDGEPALVVSFAPRVTFRPTTREQTTFQKLQGVMWIRPDRPVFLRVEADFVENASVRFGPFATITKGSHFLLQQADVEPGLAMARSLDLDLRLRIFFVVRKFERRGTYYREFKRVSPPAGAASRGKGLTPRSPARPSPPASPHPR